MTVKAGTQHLGVVHTGYGDPRGRRGRVAFFAQIAGSNVGRGFAFHYAVVVAIYAGLATQILVIGGSR